MLSGLQILLHVMLAAALLQFMIRANTSLPKDNTCVHLAAQPDGKTYIDVANLFPSHFSLSNVENGVYKYLPREVSSFVKTSTAGLPSVSTSAVLKPINMFLCRITPVFVGALSDFWGTTSLDLLYPVFMVMYAYMATQAVTERSSGRLLWKTIIFVTPLLLTIAQIVTIAVAFNLIIAPSFILLYNGTRVKKLPSGYRLSAILFSTILLYAGGLAMFGQSKQRTLWSITMFQFLPIILSFVYFSPFSIISGFPLSSLFKNLDRVTANKRFWLIIFGISAVLHVTAMSRLTLGVMDYANAPSYGMERTESLPELTFQSVTSHILNIRKRSDMGRAVLTLDYFVSVASLLIFMTFGTGTDKKNVGAFRYLPQMITLGPGAAFAMWQYDNMEV